MYVRMVEKNLVCKNHTHGLLHQYLPERQQSTRWDHEMMIDVPTQSNKSNAIGREKPHL